MSTKQVIMDEICDHLGIARYRISTGSTEPKDFLMAVADQLGLSQLVQGSDKIQICKQIVEASGNLWLPHYDSAGATITKEGLLAMQRSVKALVR